MTPATPGSGSATAVSGMVDAEEESEGLGKNDGTVRFVWDEELSSS